MNNSTESASNNQYQYGKNKNEENKEELPKRPEPRNTLIHPSLIYSQTINPPKNYGSNISDKNIGERLNSFCSLGSQPDFDPFNRPIFPTNFKNYMPIISQWHIPSFGFINSNIKEEPKIKPKIDTNKFMLNYFVNEEDDLCKDKKENKIFSSLFNYNNIKNNENKYTPKKNINQNINNKMNQIKLTIPKMDDFDEDSPKKNINTNSVTKFFTNHNYGYKCSCSKTQCNRKYCECFNSGNYCVDCNCKNCNNKPPVNSYTNKRPEDEYKSKKEKIICTCTKSGCNKNYCECFKIGQKCSSLCRCIGCENNDQIQNKKYNYNYQCNLVNSIFIIKNILYIEDVKRKKNEELFRETKYNLIGIKKRKREENKNEEENNNKIKKIEKSEELNLFNDSLFDKNGKVILSHINLFHI